VAARYIIVERVAVGFTSSGSGEVRMGESERESRGTILIVDDQEMVRTLVADMLTELDYDVILAEDGQRAVAIYGQMMADAKAQDRPEHPVDLVILDMVLPKSDGQQTFEQLRKINPEVRVILSSGYDVDDRVKDVLDHGALGFIQKPYHIETLLNMVRKVLV
jgi:two-component system cell cycle sensor histidine kinase/response regulator CckA